MLGEHRVDRAGLAGSGRAGDEQVGHLREVRADRPPGDVLAEPDRERRPVRRRVLVDVAEAHDAALRVGHLDADRLLSGDRRQDPHVGRGERVGEVVLEVGDLGDLDSRGEAQLVARDVRAGGRADDLRLDPEVPERLEQPRRDALLAGRVGAHLLGGRTRQHAAPRQPPLEVRIVGDRRAEATLRGQLLGLGQRQLLGRLVVHEANVLLIGLVELELAGEIGERNGFDRGRLDVRRAHDELAVGRLGRRDAADDRARGRPGPTGPRRARKARAPGPHRRAERTARDQEDAGQREEPCEDLRPGRPDQAGGRP